jgi:hypothetical protein
MIIMRKDSFTDIGSAFGLRSYSAVGSLLDSMRKHLATDQGLNGNAGKMLGVKSPLDAGGQVSV